MVVEVILLADPEQLPDGMTTKDLANLVLEEFRAHLRVGSSDTDEVVNDAHEVMWDALSKCLLPADPHFAAVSGIDSWDTEQGCVRIRATWRARMASREFAVRILSWTSMTPVT